MIDDIPEVARSIGDLRKFIDGFARALDALVEGVSDAADDEVRAFLPIYAQIVPVFDERLVHCADLLGRGLRDESLGYESDPPPVLEAVTLLDLASKPQWEVWKTALAAYQFPLPTMPRMDLAAALFEARNTVVEMKPLLDQWRRRNLANAPLSERIRLLRTLRQKDPNNEVWFEALIEHEKQRFMEIERDVKTAIAAKDEATLFAVVEELGAAWLEPVPGRLKAAAMAALDGFKSNRINRQLDEIGGGLAAAHEARDLEAGRQLRRQWEALLEEHGPGSAFDPRVVAAQPAVSWVKRHDRLAALSTEIRQTLDAEPGGFSARRKWVRSLERMGQEMEDLAEKLHDEVDVEPVERGLERISRVIEAFEGQERSRRRLMFTGLAVGATLIGGLVTGRQISLNRERSVRDAIAEIDKLDKGVRTGDITAFPEIEKDWPATVRGDPRVTGKLAGTRAEFQRQGARRSRLAQAFENIRARLKAVEAVRAQRKDPLQPWPEEFAAATRELALVEKAGDAVTDAEQADLTRVRGDVNGAKTRFLVDADAFVEGEVRSINSQLVELRELVSKDRGTVAAGVEEQRTRFTELVRRAGARAVPGGEEAYEGQRVTSSKVRTLLAEDGAVATQLREMAAQVVKWNGFADAVRALDEKLGDWPAYVSQLRAISTGFADVPEARDYAAAATNEPMWSAADEWLAFVNTLQPPANVTAAEADAFVKRIEALGSTTQKLQPVADFKVRVLPSLHMLANRKPADVKAAIELWIDGPWLAELRSLVRVAEDQATFYCLDVPQQGAYFKYVSGWKREDGWPQKQSVLQSEAVEPAPPFEMRERLKQAMSQWPVQPRGLQLDEFLANLMETTIASTTVDPSVRLVIMRQIFLAATEASRAFQCERARALLGKLKGPEKGVPGIPSEDLYLWVRPDRGDVPGYLVATGKAREILDQAKEVTADIRQAIKDERKLLEAVSGERLTVVGRVGRDGSGTLTASLRKNVREGTVWWLEASGTVKPAGKVDAKGMFVAMDITIPAGTPLYVRERFGVAAPGSKRDTREKERE